MGGGSLAYEPHYKDSDPAAVKKNWTLGKSKTIADVFTMAETLNEREMGRLTEGVSELVRRIGLVEVKLDQMTATYMTHPAQCYVEFRKQFISREEFESVNSFVKTIRTAILIGFLSAIGSAIVIAIKIAQAMT
jgi:hypothetical protein